MKITVEREVGLGLRELEFDGSGFEVKDGALIIYQKGKPRMVFAKGSWSMASEVEAQDA